MQRQDTIPVEFVPASPDESKELKDLGIELPTVSAETWRLIGGVADNAGKALSAPEKTNIEAILKKAGVPASSPLAAVSGAKFLIHDTSVSYSDKTIQKEVGKAKGPLGKGVSAWVPRTGGASIARPEFYDKKRPSTSEWEKSSDVIKQPARETAQRDVWKVTKATEQDPAIDLALSGTGLGADVQAKVKKGAKDFLGGTTSGLPDGAKSTAAWAIEEICNAATTKGAVVVALDGKTAELEAACGTLATYFTTRGERVGSTVSVEIVQVGVKKGATNFNTCDPKNPDMLPMSSPAYTDDQYQSLVILYLRAALMAGVFPEITTHFTADSFLRGHCDPRCFDLTMLYDGIAAALGHGKGSTYGPKPVYGTKSGTSNIWWNDTVCGGGPPQ